MVRVSIDVAAANGVVASVRGFVDEVVDEWSTVSTSARNGLCSTAPLRALSDPLEHLGRLAGELTTRVELAVLYNTGGDGGFPTQPVLSYEVSDDTLDAVKAQLGVEIAEGLRDLAPGNSSPDRSDVERFEHYTTLMEKYADDPVVTDALFDELGPHGVIEVPIMLKDLAAAYSRDLGGKFDDDLMWDEDTHMLDRIAEVQQRFLESFGEGLATSTHSDAFTSAHPDFAEELAAVATQGRNGEGWGLSQVLRFGDYEPGFLTTIGTGLYAFEKDQVGPVWGTQAGERCSPGASGPRTTGVTTTRSSACSRRWAGSRWPRWTSSTPTVVVPARRRGLSTSSPTAHGGPTTSTPSGWLWMPPRPGSTRRRRR